MIDLHSHILPGIDDGARNTEMSLAMAQQAVDAGISFMMCTPHMHWGTFDNDMNIIEPVFKQLRRDISAAGIPLTLGWAAEVRLNEMVPVWYKTQKIPFLGTLNGKKILLLELPHSHIPAGADQLIKWLIAHGVQPLIPHPERNRDVWERPEKIRWLRNLGCLFQVTAGALTGRFGEVVQDISLSMLDDNFIDLVASDTHDTKRRPNDMKEAFDLVCRQAGEQPAQRLFVETPGMIVGLST
ncbi:histidinol-phosphatase [Alteromonas sp. ZYF713]|nr:histidinol-phosphatase [Alteromonas sp. ZYF713]